MPRKFAPAIPEKARYHANRSVPIVSPHDSKTVILSAMIRRKFASAAHIAVCVEGTLVGIIRIEDLLAADDGAKAGDIMDPDPPVVTNGMDQEVAAWKAVKHGESALAVVDDHHFFIGIIPSIKLLEVLVQEHEEDLARLGGFLKSTEIARTSALESVVKRFGHRLPWLLLGLIGAMLSAGIVGRFETMLKEHILLAIFIPGIIYLADAVGTQTETLIVRGMSIGIRLRQVVFQELLTGFFIGMMLALAAFPILYWKWPQPGIAPGVCLSIFVACSTASATAMVLPWALNRLGSDPALGSGPLATVIQDLLSIVIYLFIATRFL